MHAVAKKILYVAESEHYQWWKMHFSWVKYTEIFTCNTALGFQVASFTVVCSRRIWYRYTNVSAATFSLDCVHSRPFWQVTSRVELLVNLHHRWSPQCNEQLKLVILNIFSNVLTRFILDSPSRVSTPRRATTRLECSGQRKMEKLMQSSSKIVMK